MDGLPWQWVGDHSGWVVVLFVIWCLITDKLFWHKRLDEKQHEANEWRTEGRLKDQTISELTTHNSLLKEIAANVLHILGALQERADRDET